MRKLIFATNNAHKVEEIRRVLGNRFEIVTLLEAGIDKDIPEPFDTLEDNAIEKAVTINQLTGMDCFSEDTGLEVEALNGEPGVKSARYAGEGRDFDANISKLLQKMEVETNKSARFHTVICLILDGQKHLFEGICPGIISCERLGTNGFGYDPVFIPLPGTRTFAQLDLDEKNQVSHRKKAFEKMVSFLQGLEKHSIN